MMLEDGIMYFLVLSGKLARQPFANGSFAHINQR
jgi:hypothetical protein